MQAPAGGEKAAPNWFFAGGNALSYWLMGWIQKLSGWPINSIMLKHFGLDRTPAQK